MRTGRPRVEIDLTTAEKLGALQCTLIEAAAFMNIPASTLESREDFSCAFKKGKETGKISLRRIQFRMAETSAAMAIWLGKQYLGQTEKFEVVNDDLINSTLEFKDLPSNGKGIHRFERYLHR